MTLLPTKTILAGAALVLLFLIATPAIAQSSTSPMTNSAVIKLVRAGFKEKTVIAIIHSRASRFDLEPDRLIELKRNGVSENVILAMLAQTAALSVDDDMSFSDFGREDNRQNGDRNGDGIFGGSSSSNGETSGRGIRGSNQGSQTTTGTATVKILRPPADETGASLRLEKTPTLNNESIIQLVDAGFSEGTIISRIESSPADFDLSESKVDELRRHRVTEPVIKAMKASMRDDSDSSRSHSDRSRSN